MKKGKNNTTVSVEKYFNNKKITIERGKFAKLADSSVTVSCGQTNVLVTATSRPGQEDATYFPLRVDYEERFYAGGIIGGSRFTRREGRPTDEATVSARLIDHALRPLFPKDYMDEVQIVVTVLSYDGKNDPSLLGFLGASAAVLTSGMPFYGPVAPLRIEKLKEKYTFSLDVPDEKEDMSVIVSYLENGDKVHAIEAHGCEIPEDEVVDSINKGAEQAKILLEMLEEFRNACGVSPSEYKKHWLDKSVIAEYRDEILVAINEWKEEGLYYAEKEWELKQLKLAKDLEEKYDSKYSSMQFGLIISEVQKLWVRDMVLNQNRRIDGRAFDEIRPLEASVAVLPRVHGSGLFNRGLTQALTVVTLAAPSEKLIIQNMSDESMKRYMHHYNFPPYSTGGVGRIGGANRRAIGHGILAEKSLLPVLPSEEDFPYAMRLVTEVLSSNGSTSMAATCGSSLALMDAGVPIKSHVAGIGVGLFVDKPEDNLALKEYKILTDIVGYEDFAGYMDFKMAGTRKGMTAIQMELKLQGIPIRLLGKIFEASKTARLQVLDILDKSIKKPRSALSEYAPKIDIIKVEKEFIGQIIGSGGAVIRAIMEANDVEIDIEEKDGFGIVSISSVSQESIEKAKKYIESLIKVVKVGEVYDGIVTRVENYGAFVEILPGKIGLLHVSEFSNDYVDDMSQKVKIGDKVRVKVIGTDDGKISVSKKALEEVPPASENRRHDERVQSGHRRNYQNNKRPHGGKNNAGHPRY